MDVSVRSMRIPPRCAEGLDPGLAALNGIDHLVYGERDLTPLMDSIRRASDDQISLARPQLAFALDGTKAALRDREIIHSRDRGLLVVTDCPSGAHALQKAVSHLTDDVRSALQAVDHTPGNAAALSRLRGSMQTLAEAAEFLSQHASTTYADRDIKTARAARTAVLHLGRDIDDFRAGVGSRYAEVVEKHLPGMATIQAEAAAHLRRSLLPPPDLSDRRIEGAVQTSTWRSKPEARMNPQEAAAARQAVLGVLQDYQATFHSGGFVPLLRGAAALGARKLDSSIGDASNAHPDEQQARRAAKRPRDTIGYDGWLRFFENFRENAAERSNALLPLVADLHRIIAETAPAFDRAEMPRRLLFVPDPESGAVLGEFADEKPGDSGLVIYPTPGAGGFPAAVYVAVIPMDEMRGAVPSLADAQELGYKATNFRSMEAVVCGIATRPEDCRFFFGGQAVVVRADGLADSNPKENLGTSTQHAMGR